MITKVSLATKKHFQYEISLESKAFNLLDQGSDKGYQYQCCVVDKVEAELLLSSEWHEVLVSAFSSFSLHRRSLMDGWTDCILHFLCPRMNNLAPDFSGLVLKFCHRDDILNSRNSVSRQWAA